MLRLLGTGDQVGVAKAAVVTGAGEEFQGMVALKRQGIER